MDDKSCSELPLSAGRNALQRVLMVAAVARMYLSSIATLISSIAVLKSSMDTGLTLQTWSLTHPHRKKLQRLQSGDCRGHEMIITKWFFLLWASLGWFRSRELLCHLLPDIDLTSDRWNASSRTRSWVDHQRYWQHQCWPARFIHHPFHHQPLSLHEPN